MTLANMTQITFDGSHSPVWTRPKGSISQVVVRRTKSAPASAVYATSMHLCPICCEYVTELLTMEDFAGKFHQACFCYACETCLESWVQLALPGCVANLQVASPSTPTCSGGT